MAKARLLPAVCTVALLAAAPAFAQQTMTQPADTGAGNSVNAPVAHDQTPPRPAAQSNMAPAERMDQPGGGMGSHTSPRYAMSGHSGMHAGNDSSQNAAIDQLNDQSYQAAQRGRSFSASGSMNDMSSGSPVSAASGAGGGSGAK
jgi:hypothetical protein